MASSLSTAKRQHVRIHCFHSFVNDNNYIFLLEFGKLTYLNTNLS
jgi:hypothetical protein